MIIWKSKEVPENRGDEPGNTIDWPCSAFRWVLDIAPTHISLIHQAQWKDSGVWYGSHTMLYEICRHRDAFHPHKWKIEINHVYYDGVHCMLTFGPIFIQWSGNLFTGRCEKCEGEI